MKTNTKSYIYEKTENTYLNTWTSAADETWRSLERGKGKLTKPSDVRNPVSLLPCRELYLLTAGSRLGGQVEGHLQGLVLIETIESTS